MYISDGGHDHIRVFMRERLAWGDVSLRKIKDELLRKFRFYPPTVVQGVVGVYTKHCFPAGFPEVYKVEDGMVLAGNLRKSIVRNMQRAIRNFFK